MKKRIWFAWVLVLALVISACAAPAAPTGDTSSSGEAAAPPPAKLPPNVSEFHPAYPYAAPPIGHFNTFVTNGFYVGHLPNAHGAVPLHVYVGRWQLGADCRRVLGMGR
ncbi:MAG: hypothetical protein R2867_47490 [Caldilineaceae bacterium]